MAVTKEVLKSKKSDETQLPQNVAPDGGYGWVVLFASFLVNFLVDGVGCSVGIFILEFLNEFEESKSKTAWIASVLNGMYLFIGMCTVIYQTLIEYRFILYLEYLYIIAYHVWQKMLNYATKIM